jgi:arylamine N-acetyltransferase
MFGSDGIQLFQRMAGARTCRDKSDRRLPLRSEHFPVEARGREIVTQQGVVIATAADPAMSEEIARRLNKSDWSDQEDQWAA